MVQIRDQFFLYMDSGQVHTILYDEAGVCDWSCGEIIWITSHNCDEAGAGWVLHWNAFLKFTVSSGNFCLSPQLGLEPAPNISEALAEWYRNGSQLILCKKSFSSSISSSLIPLSEIHCPGGMLWGHSSPTFQYPSPAVVPLHLRTNRGAILVFPLDRLEIH